jgi:hypothetical protein
MHRAMNVGHGAKSSRSTDIIQTSATGAIQTLAPAALNVVYWRRRRPSASFECRVMGPLLTRGPEHSDPRFTSCKQAGATKVPNNLLTLGSDVASTAIWREPA